MSVPVSIIAKYPGRCVECGRTFNAGAPIIWSPAEQVARHHAAACPRWIPHLKRRRGKNRRGRPRRGGG